MHRTRGDRRSGIRIDSDVKRIVSDLFQNRILDPLGVHPRWWRNGFSILKRHFRVRTRRRDVFVTTLNTKLIAFSLFVPCRSIGPIDPALLPKMLRAIHREVQRLRVPASRRKTFAATGERLSAGRSSGAVWERRRTSLRLSHAAHGLFFRASPNATV